MAYQKRRKNQNNALIAAVGVAIAILAALIVAIVIIVVSDGGLDTDDGSSVTSGVPQSGENTDNESSQVIVVPPVSSEEPSQPGEPSSSAPSSSVPDDKDIVKTNRLPNGDYIDYTVSGAAEADQWYLFLTNKWNPAGEDFEPESLIKINNDGHRLDSRAYGAYKDMVSAARADGVNIYSISAYRSYSRQQELYKQRIQRFINQGLSEEEAIEKAGTIVAIPGTSEHQVGLAIDFNSVEQSFENTKAGKWLAENCTDYGFILRYPTDKTEITGIIYEPWHFRFVGVKHAKKMEELDMCLEEYILYLKAQQ